jgi:hypothetical protein
MDEKGELGFQGSPVVAEDLGSLLSEYRND